MYPGRGTRIFVKTWSGWCLRRSMVFGKRTTCTPEAGSEFPDMHGATRTAPWHRTETRFPPITSPVLFVVKATSCGGAAAHGRARGWNRFPTALPLA